MHKYLVTPIGKPRISRADKWKQRPPVMRYRLFCDEIRLHEIQLPEAGGHVTFVMPMPMPMPMPQSWSKKKCAQMDGKPHQQKPDIDKLEKALLDALIDDDSHIWDLRKIKIWGEEGGIIIQGATHEPACNDHLSAPAQFEGYPSLSSRQFCGYGIPHPLKLRR